jgi:hypothetical protein
MEHISSSRRWKLNKYLPRASAWFFCSFHPHMRIKCFTGTIQKKIHSRTSTCNRGNNGGDFFASTPARISCSIGFLIINYETGSPRSSLFLNPVFHLIEHGKNVAHFFYMILGLQLLLAWNIRNGRLVLAARC